MVTKALIISFILLIFSCSLFQKGYIDNHGQYVPKHSRFKLKDRRNNIIPASLDTVNIYKLVAEYEEGVQVYPKSLSPKMDHWDSLEVEVISFIKFYSNGRCLIFSLPSINKFGKQNFLEESDLSPNNPHYSKCYYYSNDVKKILIEIFAYGEGNGIYLIADHFLNHKGDTLLHLYNKGKEVYVKEELPTHWKKYPVDW